MDSRRHFQSTLAPIEIAIGMAGRSAHVRRTSTPNEARPTARRRSSSQGDNTPRMPAPAGLALGTPVPADGALGLLHPPTDHTHRGGSVSQPHSPTAPTFSQSLASHANSTAAAIGQAKGDQATGESTGQHQQPSRRLGFLALGDMLQSSAGLLATSSHSHSHSHSNPAANPPSHPHLAAAAHSVLAATSLLAAAAPHYRAITSPIPSSLLPTRTHSRGEAAVPLDRAHSPVPPSGPPMATSPPPPSKGHTSPSKVCAHLLIRLPVPRPVFVYDHITKKWVAICAQIVPFFAVQDFLLLFPTWMCDASAYNDGGMMGRCKG